MLCACLPAAAHGGQSVKLSATLTPEQLGRGTTVGFAFEVVVPANRVPPPLTGIDLSYPESLGFAVSGLGLATCSPATLEAFGPEGCPANSHMGYGSAVAEMAVGPVILHEPAEVAIVRAATQDGRLMLLFYADGVEPVSAQILFSGLLVAAAPPFGQVRIGLPLVPSVPNAPDVAVVQLRATLGPQHLTYLEHVNGMTIPYTPRGVLLPRRCPRGGFPFAGAFTFLDGSTAVAHTTVPCPAQAARAKRSPRG